MSVKSFSWKRKCPKLVTATVDLDDGSDCDQQYPVNQKTSRECAKRRKDIDSQEFSDLLMNEGIALAEACHYLAAVAKFDEALAIGGAENYKIYEMKAQALMEVSEYFMATQSAKRAVEINPKSWISYQTLGRAQLAIGDIKSSIISFSKALHIKPDEEEVRESDLKWSCYLLQKLKYCPSLVDETNPIVKYADFVKDDAEHTLSSLNDNNNATFLQHE